PGGDRAAGEGATGTRRRPVSRRREVHVRRHHRNALGTDDDPARLVPLGIVADDGVGGDLHALVDDGAPDAAVPADLDALEQHAFAHRAVGVDAHARTEDATIDVAAR